jgi:hypothetical protein
MGFDGAAVVQSAQPIAAVLNRTMGGALGSPTDLRAAQARASADGFSIAMSEPGTQGILPVVFGGYHGYHTTISLQNTGTVPGTYTIALYPTGMPSPIASIPRALPPATAARVILGPESGVPPDFVGTAVISASASTLTAAAETMQPDSGVLMSYGDLHAGATAMNVPLLFKNYHGWVSGAQVVNMSSSPVVVNADIFQRDTPLSFGLGARTLAPNESFTYYLPGMGQLPDDFVGSGSFSANGPIAVVVQQLNDERGEAMVYSGFSGGTPNLGAPVIFRGSNGWDSGVQVQNLGAADATVNITYHLPGGGAAVDAALIAAGSSTTFYQADFLGIPVGTIGAATVNSINGQPIVAIVNEVNYMRPGDGSAAYVGINY